MKQGNWKGHLAIGIAYTIFGVNLVTTKDIANSHAVAPIALFTLRAIGATALFWLISLFTPKEKVPLADMGKIVLASMLGLFIPQFTFLKAATMATPIDIGVMGTLSPIFTMFIAYFALKEPVTVKKVGGVLLSLCGIIFLIYNSAHAQNGIDATTPAGYALLLANGLSFSAYLGIFRPLIQKYSVVTFMKWTFLSALLISLPLSAGKLLATDFGAIAPQVWLEIGFLVFFATFVAYFLIPVGQKSVRPTIVSMYTYLQPILAAVLSIHAGMDTLTWQKVLAIGVVFAGVAFVNRSRAAQA